MLRMGENETYENKQKRVDQIIADVINNRLSKNLII